MVINNSTRIEDLPELFLNEVVFLQPRFINGCKDTNEYVHTEDTKYREFWESHEDGNSSSWYVPVGQIEDWLIEKSYQRKRESTLISKVTHALLLGGIINRVKNYCEIEIHL